MTSKIKWYFWYQLALVVVCLGLVTAVEFYCYSHDNLEEKRKLYAAAQKWQDLCDSYGVVTWALFGTLLGAVRENAIIETDDDVDFAIHQDDWPAMCNALTSAGVSFTIYWPGSLVHISLYDCTLDVFLFGEVEDEQFLQRGKALKLVGRAGEYWGDAMALYLGTSSEATRPELEVRPFGSTTIRTPLSADELLCSNYGTDWMVPRRWAGHTLYQIRGSYAYGIFFGVVVTLVAAPSLVCSVIDSMTEG